MKALRELACLPIRFYQRYLSPLKPPMCRFQPTCSEYGLRAIRTHGVLKGILLTAWRILRCNPFTEPGPDPVPPRGAWKAVDACCSVGEGAPGADGPGSGTSEESEAS